HRIGFLQEHYCPEPDDNILLVTFNKTLLKYIQYQFNHLENEAENELQNFFKADTSVMIENIDKLMFQYFIKYQKRHKVQYKLAPQPKIRQLVQRAILEVQKEYQDIKVMSLKNSHFLLDEIDWMKACDIPDLETYQSIDRIGRSDGGKGNPQKLTKNSKTRESIYT